MLQPQVLAAAGAILKVSKGDHSMSRFIFVFTLFSLLIGHASIEAANRVAERYESQQAATFAALQLR